MSHALTTRGDGGGTEREHAGHDSGTTSPLLLTFNMNTSILMLAINKRARRSHGP